jgi:D-lactate dehydrogenase (cytochrome)
MRPSMAVSSSSGRKLLKIRTNCGPLVTTPITRRTISRLADCITETKHDLEAASFPATIVGHVGDGNFHVLCVLDSDNAQQFEAARRFADRTVERALKMGGTCTGEHGIGYGKIRYLRSEHGEALDVMRTIKQALDPENRMNPGKIIEI